MKIMKTLYWHDYETWGANPATDRASQFAGVRTDEDLNIIGEPLVMYCKPPEDLWPNPMACLITGITPQQAQDKGIQERQFIELIFREFSQPGTCGVGYNTIRFDDEVTRYTLFRNFYDPYEREWRNGNSRWDIIDMVRAVYALRPEGIEWPVLDDKPSFKLEYLTQANGISHGAAHDAFSDVEATIGLAKLIKQKQPQLYDYVYQHRMKNKVSALIDLAARKPLLHISSRFPATRGCAGLIAPLAIHPVNKNAIIVIDLSVDPSPLLHLTPEQIRQRVFVSNDDLPEGEERLPIKLIHLNKCPVLATPKLITAAHEQRLGLDKTLCEKHWQMIRHWDIASKLQEMYRLDNFTPSADPEAQLYNGFVNDRDKSLMAQVRNATAEELAKHNYLFEDERLNRILIRYKARNFYDALTQDEKSQWQEFVRDRLFSSEGEHLHYTSFLTEVEQLQETHAGDADKQNILQALRVYAEQCKAKYFI
ncbi:Exodeoxyribonuclease I [Thalassocella blandensis]|nr:Exodeoxyribonuclease I [Thalassocella blandensis]